VVAGKNSVFLIAFVSLIAAASISTAQILCLYSNVATANIAHSQTTVLIVLTGLLYISFVLNRKLSLTSMTAPLNSGQVSFHSVPQFYSKITKKHIRLKSFDRTICRSNLKDTCRLDCCRDSTQNTSLDHDSEGIPNEKVSLPHVNIHDKHLQELITKKFPKINITHFSPLLHKALIYMAPRAEQNLSFSPGFIFVRLARGPPKHT
jgi:hypothetical protein